MEAQAGLASGVCLNVQNPLTQTLKTPFSLKLLLPPPSSHSFVLRHKCFSIKTCLSVSPPSRRTVHFSRLQCLNSIGNIGSGVLEKEDNRKMEVKRKKLAVFVSGGGSNFRAIHEACNKGLVHGDVVVLVTNKHTCGGAEYARSKGIPVIVFPRTKEEPEGLSSSDLVTALRKFDVDFILLAGYLKLVPTELIRAYPQAILNIHPSLLPAFGGKGYYGMKVHKAVIASGARYSGPTIHFVDEHYDTGRILAQKVVPVLANDTAEQLAARVLQEEHQLYVEVTAALCEECIVWREDGVPLMQSRENPNEYS